VTLVAHLNPATRGFESAAAWLIATNRANSVNITAHRTKIGRIRLVDEVQGIERTIRLNPNLPPLLSLGRRTNNLVEKMALGMSYPNGDRSHWSPIITELGNPKTSLETLMPTQQSRRIEFIAEILRGLIFDASEHIAAYQICETVHIDELGHAHLPVNVGRHLAFFLFRRGALVVTFDDGKAAIGVKLSKEAQELGLDGRDFEGLPNHWHREEWTVIYGSNKAPKPYDEAGITAEELQVVVRDNLARFHTQLEEEE